MDVTHCFHRSCYLNTIRKNLNIGATMMMTMMAMITGQHVADAEMISPTPIHLAAMLKAKIWSDYFKRSTNFDWLHLVLLFFHILSVVSIDIEQNWFHHQFNNIETIELRKSIHLSDVVDTLSEIKDYFF